MPYAREHPSAYPRRILLAVTGLSPQIVTETLYALAVAPEPGARAFVPSEIHLVTTRSGAEKARLALAPAQLTIDLAARRIRAAGRVFALPPAELALLSVFARRVLRGEPPLPAPPKDVPDPEWRQRYRSELQWIDGPFREREKTEAALRKGMDGGYFSAHLSKLRRLLEQQLGAAAAPYLVSDGGRRPRRYRLALPSSAVCYDAIDVGGGD